MSVTMANTTTRKFRRLDVAMWGTILGLVIASIGARTFVAGFSIGSSELRRSEKAMSRTGAGSDSERDGAGFIAFLLIVGLALFIYGVGVTFHFWDIGAQLGPLPNDLLYS